MNSACHHQEIEIFIRQTRKLIRSIVQDEMRDAIKSLEENLLAKFGSAPAQWSQDHRKQTVDNGEGEANYGQKKIDETAKSGSVAAGRGRKKGGSREKEPHKKTTHNGRKKHEHPESRSLSELLGTMAVTILKEKRKRTSSYELLLRESIHEVLQHALAEVEIEDDQEQEELCHDIGQTLGAQANIKSVEAVLSSFNKAQRLLAICMKSILKTPSPKGKSKTMHRNYLKVVEWMRA